MPLSRGPSTPWKVYRCVADAETSLRPWTFKMFRSDTIAERRRGRGSEGVLADSTEMGTSSCPEVHRERFTDVFLTPRPNAGVGPFNRSEVTRERTDLRRTASQKWEAVSMRALIEGS